MNPELSARIVLRELIPGYAMLLPGETGTLMAVDSVNGLVSCNFAKVDHPVIMPHEFIDLILH